MEAAIRQRVSFNKEDGSKSAESADETVELILDGCKIRSIDSAGANFLSQFTNLEVLSANQTCISSISSFPLLPKLKILELQDNYLANAESIAAIVEKVPNLAELSIAGNRFKAFQDILPYFAKLNLLKVLDVELNPFVQDPLYRHAAFQALPSLETVDGVDRNGNEVGGEQQEGDEDEDEESDDENGINEGKECLKNFYEADPETIDEDDGADFSPLDGGDEEEELESDADEEDSDEDAAGGGDEDINSSNNGINPAKRPVSASSGSASSAKRQKYDSMDVE